MMFERIELDLVRTYHLVDLDVVAYPNPDSALCFRDF